MTVPLVQGTLRYAYKNGAAANGASAKNAAEGATFAAAVLPLVHYCNTASSAVVSANLKFGLFPDGGAVEAARYSDFTAVKAALEDVYACLGITCDMVGGLLDGAAPYSGAEACTGNTCTDICDGIYAVCEAGCWLISCLACSPARALCKEAC